MAMGITATLIGSVKFAMIAVSTGVKVTMK